MEQLVRRVRLLVREQHQHHRGWRAFAGLSCCADSVRSTSTRARRGSSRRREDNLEGEDVARGTRCGHLREAPEPAVRGSDEDEARQPGNRGSGREDRQPATRGVPRGEPDRGPQIVTKAIAARNARQAARKARELTRRKSALDRTLAAGQARRLPRSRTRNPRSSSSSRVCPPAAPPVEARDRSYQAILPLRGKVINAEKNRINKVLSNEEIQAIITAIGTGIADEFDIEKLRYHRIIVMTDADVDGAHIRTLISHVPVPADAGARRARLRLHGRPSALPREDRLAAALHREGVAVRGPPRARAHQGHGRDRPGRARDAEAHRGAVGAPRPGSCSRVRRHGSAQARGLRPGCPLSSSTTGSSRRRAPARRGRARRTRRSPNGYELAVLEDDRRRHRGARRRDGNRRRGQRRSCRPRCSRPRSTRTSRKTYAASSRSWATRRSTSPSGRRRRHADTFGQLREAALELAKEGMQVEPVQGPRRDGRRASSRTRRWIPAHRTLIRVEVEDAAAADRVFSMLMGDQVEPRRPSSSRTRAT